MEINYSEILNTDVSFLLDYFNDTGHIKGAQEKVFPQIEHYKLITYLGKQFNNSILIDAGTHHGLSAICLAQNKTNKIYSYDIVKFNRDSITNCNCNFQHTPIAKDYDNIHFINKDINKEDNNIINDSPFILFDIMHEGKDEMIFSKKLTEINYNGYILCDDIKTNMFKIEKWFNDLKWDKYDITDIGHFSGSGLLDCGKNGVKIIK